MMRLNSAWVKGSRPLVGSSRMSSLGLPMSAMTRATF